MPEPRGRERPGSRVWRQRDGAEGRESVPSWRAEALSVLAVALAGIGIWYAAAALVNAAGARAGLGGEAGLREIIAAAWSMERPLLPAPHQVAGELWHSLFAVPPHSPRSLFHHAAVTLSAALSGLSLGLGLGLLLAIGIVHVPLLERSLMPWLVASQTVPVLAIAPMVVVVLGRLGFGGLLPKAAIAAYLAFFPIAVGMVTGLRSPDPLALDLLRTYDARPAQVFRFLRWPAALGFLFPSLRVAASLALVGAIVAELPTGAVAGLGARLLAGSYYGQTVQIWAALFMSGALALGMLAVISLIEAVVMGRRGGRR
jgi:NitT/TauT family transport system permease protein